MKSYTQVGRLIPVARQIFLGYFRWMGQRCCDVQVSTPIGKRKSGGSTSFTSLRGKRRRGTRGRRSGRKRRAVIRDAPGTSRKLAISQSVRSNRSAKQFGRSQDYSRRMIERLKSLVETRDRLMKLNRNVNTWTTWRHNRIVAIRMIIRRTRKDWIDLASKRSDDSRSFILLRLTLLVSGIDTVYGHLIKRGMIPYAERVDVYNPTLGEHGGSTAGSAYHALENGERPVSHKWECTKCQRTSGLKFCRLCGADLTNPDQGLRPKNRRGARKPTPRRT